MRKLMEAVRLVLARIRRLITGPERRLPRHAHNAQRGVKRR